MFLRGLVCKCVMRLVKQPPCGPLAYKYKYTNANIKMQKTNTTVNTNTNTELQIHIQTHNCKYTWSKCGLESSPPLPLSWWGAPIDRRQKTNTRILFKEMHICKYTNTDQNFTDLSNISVWKSGKIRNFLFMCSQNKQIANSGGNSFIRIYQSWIAMKKLYENCIAEKIRGSRPFDLIHSFHFPFSTLILYLLEPQICPSIKSV